MGMKKKNRVCFQGVEKSHMYKYAEYLIFRHIEGLVAKKQTGVLVQHRNWVLSLSYEHEITTIN